MTDPTYINPTLHREHAFNPKVVLKKSLKRRPNTMANCRSHPKLKSDIQNSLPPSLRQEMQKVAQEQNLHKIKRDFKNQIYDDYVQEKVIKPISKTSQTSKNIGEFSESLKNTFQREILKRETHQRETQKEENEESFEKLKFQKRRVQTQRGTRPGYLGRRSQANNYQKPLDLRDLQGQESQKNNFFPNTAKSTNIPKHNEKEDSLDNFTSAARKGLKTRAASRKGFGYFYKSSYQKYYHPSDLPKESPKPNPDKGYSPNSKTWDPSKAHSIHSLNNLYAKFLLSDLTKWKLYEQHWLKFSSWPQSDLRAENIPLPVDSLNFIFHMKRVMDSKTEIRETGTKESWQKWLREALRRYHPDKFTQNFGKYLKDQGEKDEILEKINQLWQILTTQFQF